MTDRLDSEVAVGGTTPREIVARRLSGIRKRENSRSWVHGYQRTLMISDLVVVVATTVGAQWLRFGWGDADVLNGTKISANLVSLCLIVGWLASLRAFQSLDRRIIGSGAQEYSRVVTACLATFGALAIIDLLFKLDVARGFVAVALPVGIVVLPLSRWAWRRRLARRRKANGQWASQYMDRVLVVGELSSAVPLIWRLSDPTLGYAVVGLCTPSRSSPRSSVQVDGREIPVLGDFDDVCAAADVGGATTVAVTSAEALGHEAMQELSWDLEGRQIEMLVSPGVTDVAGPRMLVRPVAGLPLLHIDKPRYEGANKFRKAALDRLGAVLMLIALSPILLLVAFAVTVDSRGPVFYRANRIGLNNRPFEMWKFRSMVINADALRADLVDRNEGAGVLFKMRDDPRVTRVGKFIRRYSLDELPQLFNVLSGTMSLVGPRPPLPDEVERYDGRVARRMLVKPGLTGLWQVSGRSDLSWEESVRLDLSYVENWSIMQDMAILWRTAKAVVGKDGAY
ncbi:sugar transferase [Gordonia sp. NPDC003504]